MTVNTVIAIVLLAFTAALAVSTTLSVLALIKATKESKKEAAE